MLLEELKINELEEEIRWIMTGSANWKEAENAHQICDR